MSELWEYVRSVQPTMALGTGARPAPGGRDRKRQQKQAQAQGHALLMLHPAAATCCSYATSEGSSAWAHLAGDSPPLAQAFKADQEVKERGGERDKRAVSGVPVALPPGIPPRSADSDGDGAVTEVIARDAWVAAAAMPLPDGQAVLSALAPIPPSGLEATLAMTLASGEGTPLFAELAPGGERDADGLVSETARRFEDLTRRSALGPDAAELRGAFASDGDVSLEADAARVARSFLMHELGPALSRLG